jgi:hypothetical protein
MGKSLEQVVRENIDNIRQWRSEGYTCNQICRKINVKQRTLYLYIRTIPELADAWEYGNTKLVNEVLEPAILKQALQGMPYIETVEERQEVIDKDGRVTYEMVVTKKTHKTVYSPAILKYVLACLAPDKWGKAEIKDEKKLELSHEMDIYGT